MKTQNTQIQKHNDIVSITPTQAPSAAPNLADLPLPESGGPDAERRRAFIRESIDRKQRADSFFRSLNSDQQLQLVDWLGKDTPLSTIMENLSAPPPKGFGVKVHITSLRRLRSYCRGVDEAFRTEEILDTIDEMDRHCDLSQQPRIQEAISQMLHQKAFQLARTHPGSEVLGEVLSSITKLAALDYKREKLLLDRQKLLRSFTSDKPKHHRVDLNIIPPARPVPESVQVDLPQPNPRQISDNQTATEPPAPRRAPATPADISPNKPGIPL